MFPVASANQLDGIFSGGETGIVPEGGDGEETNNPAGALLVLLALVVGAALVVVGCKIYSNFCSTPNRTPGNGQELDDFFND